MTRLPRRREKVKRLARGPAGILVGLCSIASAMGCSSQPEPPRSDVPVIIYLVDTLRADRLGAYGYPRPTSPRLDALSAQSAIFEAAYAPAPWTVPSVASLMTSTFACEHGVTQSTHKLNPVLRTLAERLSDIGFATAGYYNNVFLGLMTGLERGHESFELKKLPDNARATDVRRFVDRMSNAVGDGTGHRPFYLYLHTMEPHDPPAATAPFIRHFGEVSREQLVQFAETRWQYGALRSVDTVAGRPLGSTDNTASQDAAIAMLDPLRAPARVLYDAVVRESDQNLGDVLDVLERSGVWDRAIFVFLSDHGEEFGEHGAWIHGQSVYEEMLRVPLMIHFPGGEHAGRRIRTPVSLVDVMPTIFDALGRPELCDDCRGQSLLPLIRGEDGVPRAASSIHGVRINETDYYRPHQESRGNVNVVVRQRDWKGIWNAELETLELYDLGSDPEERSNLSGQHPQLTQDLSRRASEWLARCTRNRKAPERVVPLDGSTKQQLRELGYFR